MSDGTVQRVSIGVLGPIVVLGRGGVPSPVRSTLQRLLLAVLAARAERVVTADELIEALWREALPADPRAALQSQVSRLRRRLGDATALETTPAGYRLMGRSGFTDAARFEDLLAAARTEADRPEMALNHLDEALALWRGRAYLEVAEHDAVRFEAARLQELQADATEGRAECLLALGRSGEASSMLERLEREEPFRERPVALRMRALRAAGRQADALEVFAGFRRRLGEELGLEPSPDLRSLEGQILRHEMPAGARVRAGLPGNSFVGRAGELEEIAACLGRSRLVTLVGPGGVGKTRLARQAARLVGDRYPEGVYICELAPVAEPGAVAVAVASTLALEARSGRSVTDRVVEFLRAKRALLVVDNCEHLQDGVRDLIGAILARTADVDVLATSRQRLSVEGEHRLVVDPLPVPPGDDLTSPAVVLFAHRAAAVRPGFALNGENLGAICELCRKLEGLPLAIELAAARCVARTPIEILAEINDWMGRLGDRRRPVDRHGSMDAAVGWSYELLEPGEQTLFRQLAVFAGGFTGEAANDAAGHGSPPVIEQLIGLVDHSLVMVEDVGGRTRYAMLEPVRQYAEARLRAEGALDEMQARQAAWAIRWAETADARLRGPDEGSWHTALEAELANLRVAHRWCLAHDADGAVRLSALYWSALWHAPSEVFDWATATVEQWDDQPARSDAAPGPHPLLPAVYAVAAAGAWRRNDLERARTLAERGVGVAPAGDPYGARFAWEALGDTELHLGNSERALACLEQAITLGLGTGDAVHSAVTTAQYPLYLAHAGHLDRAAAALAGAVPAIPDNPTCRAFCDYVAGELRADAAPEEALPLLRRSLATARAAGNRFLAGIVGTAVVSCAARVGDPAEAIADYAELVDHWHRAGAWNQQWTTILALVETLTRLGRDEPAAVLYGALTCSPTATPIFGADADRLADTVAALGARLGPERWAGLVTEGAGLGDERSVAYALACVRGGGQLTAC